MSRLPSPEGAQKVLALLEKQESLLAEVDAARTQVEALRGATARCKKADEALYATTREIGELLENMDCSSAGNFGFEGRMGWLMGELRRLIMAKVPQMPAGSGPKL